MIRQVTFGILISMMSSCLILESGDHFYLLVYLGLFLHSVL